MKSPLLASIALLSSLVAAIAQTPPAVAPSASPLPAGPTFSLEQFGAVKTPGDAEKAYQKASEDIIAAGGGVLVIPGDAAAGWKPKNNTQEQWRKPAPPATAKSWGAGAGVTVVDTRSGTLKIQPPQATGIQIERELNIPQGQSLPHWGYYPMLRMKNTVLHGSTSYHDWLQEDVAAGTDRRFYVATIRGIFPGEFLNGLAYSGGVPRLHIKSLGYDREKKAWFFVADTEIDVKKGALLSNKNHVNVLDMETFSHSENQTFDVRMWRHNYSQGDNYLFDARFKYMGDVHSTAGDENGVLYAAFVEAETKIFRGKVASWDAATAELKFAPGPLGETLGSGRPIINMNPAKWITKGTVNLVRPASWTGDEAGLVNPVFHGKSYPTTVEKNKLGINSLNMGGLIRLSADAPVTEDAVGRYFSVDEKDECVPNTDVRRWFLIDRVTKNADGTKDIRIVRHWWGAKSAGGLTLYKPESYSWDGHEKPLHYIIAPGANAYDVSDGVNNPKRTLKLSPSPFAGTDADFAAGDAIEQAIGPDPFKPISFRSWLWDAVPGAFPAPVMDIVNNGVMRDTMLAVRGGSGNFEKETATRYDRSPAWDRIIDLSAASNVALKFSADAGNAAILFTQPNDRMQPIKWHYGTDKDAPPRVASLTVARDTGEFTFTGGGARFDGPLTTTGLSADAKASRNLRGKNVAVREGQTTVTIAFAVEEADEDYAVFVEQSWISNRAVVKKKAKGFVVQFDKPAPDGAKVDWMIVR